MNTHQYAVAKKRTNGYPVGAVFKLIKEPNGTFIAFKQNFATSKFTNNLIGVSIGQYYTYTAESVQRIFTKPVDDIVEAVAQSFAITE